MFKKTKVNKKQSVHFCSGFGQVPVMVFANKHQQGDQKYNQTSTVALFSTL